MGPRRFWEEPIMLSVPELLSPAGDLERLRYAVCYGADAVYCGMQEFGMRSAPANFTPETLTEGVIFAHARGRRVYLTLNTLPTNEELDRLPETIRTAAAAGVDAFIVADLGVIELCKKYAPEVDIHFSTQMGIANYAAATAAFHMGARRVVLARELTLTDIAVIRDRTPPELELEAFVHGAMCVSFSGRCLLSTFMTGRDSNRGQCAQPCRWRYHICEERRPGQYYEIGESPEGSYILNADDLCTAPFLDLVCRAGVDSLKIEGRAKTFYYVASVTAAYRRALDTYLADPEAEDFQLPEDVYEELTRTSHRRYSPGFYLGREKALQRPDSIGYIRAWDFMATVDRWENGVAYCQQRGKWTLGETLEALTPDGKRLPLTPAWIRSEAGELIDATPCAMQRFSIPCETPLPPMTLLRKQNTDPPAAVHPLGQTD
jgi:putative protease